MAEPDPRASRRRRGHFVRVVLTTRPDAEASTGLVATLDALEGQSRQPDEVVILPFAAPDDDEGRAALEAHPLVRQGTARWAEGEGDEPQPVLTAFNRALHSAADESDLWCWLLDDTCQPQPHALERMLATARRSSVVGVVGPKFVREQDPRVVVGVGQVLTPAGRDVDAAAGSLDQGQYDQRHDVLGVPAVGMLVDPQVVDLAGSFDTSLHPESAGLDLAWRSHLAGRRVLVAPDAVVHRDAVATLAAGGKAALRVRREWRQIAGARTRWWRVPFRSVGVLLTSLLALIALLLVKRPREARGEWADIAAVLTPWRRWGMRWRFRGRRSVRDSDLRGLFASPGVGARQWWDVCQEALTPGGRRTTQTPSGAETGPVSEEAESLGVGTARRWSWIPIITVLVALGISMARFRDHFSALSGSGFGLSSSEVPSLTGSALSLWQAWQSAWHGPGFGSEAPYNPALLPLAGITWLAELLPGVEPSSGAGIAVAWAMFLAPVAAALSFYLASRVVVQHRLLRAVAALIWSGAPPLTEAISELRLGPALVHVAAPLLIAVFAVAARSGAGPRRTATTFAGALLLGIVGMVAPLTLVAASVGGVVLTVLGPGWGRLRGVVLALLPWALQGPWLLQLWQDPRLALAGPGMTATGTAPPSWQTLLWHTGGVQPLSLWWTLPILLLAVVGLLRTGAAGRRVSVLTSIWIVASAAAVAAPSLVLGQVPAGFGDAGADVMIWQGSLISLAAAAALLVAGAAVAPGLARDTTQALDSRGRGVVRVALYLRRPVSIVLSTVAATAGLAVVAWSAWSGLGSAVAVAGAPMPAVVQEQARSGEAIRLLTLDRQPGTLDVQVQGREGAWMMRDRVRELVPSTSMGTHDAEAVEASTLRAAGGLIGGVVTSPEAQDLDENQTEVASVLHELAVGYVSLRTDAATADEEADPASNLEVGSAAAPSADEELIEQLDSVPGLTRLSTVDGQVLWRVQAVSGAQGPVGVSRAALLEDFDRDSTLATVPVTGDQSRIQHDLPEPTSEGQVLAIAQDPGWAEAAVVRADGVALSTVDASTEAASQAAGSRTLRYELPLGTEQLEVTVTSRHDAWRLATLALAAVAAFLALPFGSRGRRSA